MKQLLINSEGLETRVALVEDGELVEYFIQRTDEDHLVGSIFKGVIRNLEPSLQAAFVDIGVEKNAFLHYWDMIPASIDALEDADSEGGNNDSEGGGSDKQPAEPTEPTEPTEPAASGVLAKVKRRLFQTRTAAKPKGGGGGKRPRRSTVDIEQIPELFPVRSEVLVQVTKGPIGTKGARVTTNLSIPGRYLVLLPNSQHVGVSKRIDDRKERDRIRQILRKLDLPAGTGLICRTLGAEQEEEVFQRDFQFLHDAWDKAQERARARRAPCCVYREPNLVERALRDYLTADVQHIVADSDETHKIAVDMIRRLHRERQVKTRLYRGAEPLFGNLGLTPQIENTLRRRVPLPSGGHICIDETEALIAIDVNSGKSRGGKDHPETILSTNLEAVDEIAKQLRLRNLGGLLVLDLIDMRSRTDRQTVYRALKVALANDRAKTKTVPISPLGLVEMTRQREHESLLGTLYSDCPYCRGKGLVKSPKSVSVEIQRRLQAVLRKRRSPQLRVMVHPHVLERLKNDDADLLHEMERALGGELSFRPNAELHLEEFRVIDLSSGKEL